RGARTVLRPLPDADGRRQAVPDAGLERGVLQRELERRRRPGAFHRRDALGLFSGLADRGGLAHHADAPGPDRRGQPHAAWTGPDPHDGDVRLHAAAAPGGWVGSLLVFALYIGVVLTLYPG